MILLNYIFFLLALGRFPQTCNWKLYKVNINVSLTTFQGISSHHFLQKFQNPSARRSVILKRKKMKKTLSDPKKRRNPTMMRRANMNLMNNLFVILDVWFWEIIVWSEFMTTDLQKKEFDASRYIFSSPFSRKVERRAYASMCIFFWWFFSPIENVLYPDLKSSGCFVPVNCVLRQVFAPHGVLSRNVSFNQIQCFIPGEKLSDRVSRLKDERRLLHEIYIWHSHRRQYTGSI